MKSSYFFFLHEKREHLSGNRENKSTRNYGNLAIHGNKSTLKNVKNCIRKKIISRKLIPLRYYFSLYSFILLGNINLRA